MRSAFNFVLISLILAWSGPSSVLAAAAEESDPNAATSDYVKSLALAQRLIAKAKERENPPPSWTYLLEVMERAFLGVSPNHHSPREEEARRSALHWLAHEDGSPSELSEESYDQGLLQRYALATAYFATGGDDWSQCSRKKTSSNHPNGACESDDERYLSPHSHLKWDGINGKNGQVTWLDLSGRGLTSDAFLPLEVTLMSPSLELLWASENENLGGTLPDYLGEFQSLVSLSVYGTSVSGTIPDSIYGLKKLASIRLYKSQFQGTISSQIGNLTDLKWLWIHDNKFAGTLPEEVGELAKLEGITLHHNLFSSEVENGVKTNKFVPDSLCTLKKGKILKHLWTDCDERALAQAEDGGVEGKKEAGGIALKEGARACVCCTRCFPPKSEAVAIAEKK